MLAPSFESTCPQEILVDAEKESIVAAALFDDPVAQDPAHEVISSRWFQGLSHIHGSHHGSRRMSARCLHDDAGANTDDPGAMTRDGPWLSESPFKEFKECRPQSKDRDRGVTRRNTTDYERSGMIRGAIRQWCDPWMCELHWLSFTIIIILYNSYSPILISQTIALNFLIQGSLINLPAWCWRRKYIKWTHRRKSRGWWGDVSPHFFGWGMACTKYIPIFWRVCVCVCVCVSVCVRARACVV